VLTPRPPTPARSRRAARAARSAAAARAALPPSIPAASAGVQPHSPLSTGAVISSLALGAASTFAVLPPPAAPAHPASTRSHAATRPTPAIPRIFTFGREQVHLHSLRVGSRLIAGTVIGHLGAAVEEAAPAAPGAPAGAASLAGPQAELIFQIRPSGVGAPLIDPKPILDSWVKLESSLAYRATGKHRFPAASAAPSTIEPRVKPPRSTNALASAAPESALTPGEWLQLMARLGAIPDPVVAGGHSAAAIPDHPGAPSSASGASTGSTAGQGSGASNSPAEQSSGVYN